VIFAIPPHNLTEIKFSPELPETKIKSKNTLNYSEKYIKTFVIYPQRWWLEKNFSGQFLSSHGPLLWSVDGHKNDCKLGVLVGFISFEIFFFFNFFLIFFFSSGDQYEKWGNLPIEKRREAIIQQYYKLLGNDARALHFLDYYEKDWSKEEHSSPCVFSLSPNLGFFFYFIIH
jgi:monoamine oxidase